MPSLFVFFSCYSNAECFLFLSWKQWKVIFSLSLSLMIAMSGYLPSLKQCWAVFSFSLTSATLGYFLFLSHYSNAGLSSLSLYLHFGLSSLFLTITMLGYLLFFTVAMMGYLLFHYILSLLHLYIYLLCY